MYGPMLYATPEKFGFSLQSLHIPLYWMEIKFYFYLGVTNFFMSSPWHVSERKSAVLVYYLQLLFGSKYSVDLPQLPNIIFTVNIAIKQLIRQHSYFQIYFI